MLYRLAAACKSSAANKKQPEPPLDPCTTDAKITLTGSPVEVKFAGTVNYAVG